MLTKVMDFDPRITSYGSGYAGGHCNFHFGYGYDVIDEDVKNEKSCVQALGYLIAKADAEICDLEDDLAVLQCQLKWVESDEKRDPYEVCCAAFKRKIDSLTSSIEILRNKNVLNEHDLGTTLEIQRPAERVCDIISALIRNNFSESDEQVGDLSNEKNLLVNSGSLNIDMDKRQEVTTVESSTESEELMTVFKRQDKPARTASEESSSDAAKYTTKDPNDVRNIDKPDVEVTGKTEVDNYGCPSEGKSGFLTSFKSIVTQTLQHVESAECTTVSKKGGSGLSPLSTKTEVIVKVEEDNASIQHAVAADSLSKTLDHEKKDLVESHLKAIEHQSQSVENAQITYGRKNSSLSSVLKPQGEKVQGQNLGDVEQPITSLILKPQGMIQKRESPSIGENFGQSSSPSSMIEGTSPFQPETSWQRRPGIEEDVAHGNPPRVLGVKRRQPQGASKESARGRLASKSRNGVVMCLESPNPAELKTSVFNSNSANLHTVGSKSTIVDGVQTTDLPLYDLENLRLKLSQEPDFLKKLKASELKEIMKHNKLRGSYKLKKEKMIEELTKQLDTI